ncbi:ATP-dependent helicase HrpB [Cohnella abietis]|uniref:ATP-dependent helicase HrpB n=1 Tax=Cohnella abietis TaxID=2507935 RepID=A0A3T1DB62_9BACL|nr:ATP-dependent helicase HrpB [Cohnella abietis]BBI35319.1 ATP-dependent helicase HrpB [Cohnella abietis]
MVLMPIDSVIPDLKQALLDNRNTVLTAAPGAGKTTRVPLALLNEPWLNGQKIIMLEPRRLAARSSAKYMASTLGEAVGGTIGYRVKMDTKVGPLTRIEVVTEGVLTRMLQADPSLEGIGLVIFDEFHERSLQADLGLALCLQCQDLLRDDLKMLVMSATLEAEPVAELLGGVPVISSVGRSYPVETIYRPKPSGSGYMTDGVAQVIIEALRAHEGDVLVFLPGIGEIRSVESKLRASLRDASIRIFALHGGLSAEAQDEVLAPVASGQRKIVLATSVAETSLTVEGITVVIDSGLMRVSRFSPRTGMSRLETITVSVASADQRRGRAGRLMPGTCYRLWSQEEEQSLSSRSAPEIMEADLAPLLLELYMWGVKDAAQLAWLDNPPAPALQQARDLLVQLGALDKDGQFITPHGRQMAEFGKHPRIAHMLLRAIPIGFGSLASELAVLLEARDIIRFEGKAPTSDLRVRLEALRGRGGYATDEGARRRLVEEVKLLQREHGIKGAADPEGTDCGLLLAFAYPDRIGRRRDNGKYLLSGGRGAEFASGQALAHEQWIVVADVDDMGSDSRIRLAAPISMEQIATHLQDEMNEETQIYWDSESKSVRGRSRKRLGALQLGEKPLSRPPANLVLQALLEGIRTEGLELLPWTKAARQLQERTVFVRHHDNAWPDLSDLALLNSLEQWLAGYIDGMKGRSDLQRLNLKDILESMLSWEQRRELENSAPTHWTVPSGSRIPIDYSDINAPLVAVRLQELFGLPETPRIAGGRVPLTLHLLSPAQRPVQVTRDLASFWSHTYFEVRKDLKGRYPKHYWPDNPLEAEATRRAKPFRT